MDIKMLEIRDRATFIPAMAIALAAGSEAERFLLRRAGFAQEQILPDLPDGYERYIILVRLDPVQAQYDPYSWETRARTIPMAHQYLIEHWGEIQSGDVIDIEFLNGEKPTPKLSERFTVVGGA